MNDIFISHKSEYKPWVDWLARMLQAQQRSVFVDNWHVVPAQSWIDGLHQGVQQCRSAVLVATPEAVNSGWVRLEYESLLQRRLADPNFKLVPLVLGELPNLPFLKNLQCVDCRNPADYRRWFHQLMCGLDGRAAGERWDDYPGLTAPPEWIRRPGADATTPEEQRFADRVMQRLFRPTCPPVMVVSQGERPQGAVLRRLLEQARARFGARAVMHVVPPFSSAAGTADCFAELGRQCRLPAPSPDAIRFVAAFEQHLGSHRDPVLLLISGYENAAAALRDELAQALRSLTERHAEQLRVLLVGGHRLVEQHLGRGGHSFLSSARVEEWPHPSVADVLAWSAHHAPALPLDPAAAQALLDVTGGHAALVQHGLEQWADRGPPPQWEHWAQDCHDLWSSWMRLRRDAEPAAWRKLLQRHLHGPAMLWPADDQVRALYWADLLAANPNRQLVWRSELIRQVGLQVMA